MQFATSYSAGGVASYVDYVLTVEGVKNPENAILRSSSRGDYDYIYASSSSDSGLKLWNKYDEYTFKFELGLFNAKLDAAGAGNFLNTKAHGVLNSAWLGYKPSKTLLYILD